MQTVEHAIVMTRPKGLTPQRATGLIFAGLLQAAMIFALVEGLHVKILPLPETSTKAEVLPGKVKPPPLPHLPVHMTGPSTPTIAPPIYDIDYGGERAITWVKPQDNPAGDNPASSIAATHTTPPYPPLAIRLGEFGKVRLHLTVSPQGAVTEAAVVRSSGFDDLDQTARNWVVAHWRYKPALRNGVAVASTADVVVVFDLKNAN